MTGLIAHKTFGPVLGALFGVLIAYGLVQIPYLYDTYRDDLHSWKYTIESQVPGETVLSLSACKRRGLALREFVTVEAINGESTTKRVRPIAWALSADGQRRKVDIVPAKGNRAQSYPAGCSSFGKWRFIDRQPAESAPPIVAYQVGVTLIGRYGDKAEVSTPFAIR